jgi:hypothetical protein
MGFKFLTAPSLVHSGHYRLLFAVAGLHFSD